MSQPVRIGLLRLADSAPVLVAASRGVFQDCGLAVRISVEPSWANIADKLTYGLLDAAVMLPPLALACTLGLRGVRAPLLVPMGISQGGNSVVLSTAVATAVGGETGAMATGRRFAAWAHAQPEPPRIAVVHVFSTHNLLLRYWLAACGVDPDRDVRIVSVPPELVVAAMAAGAVAGFCAGAPWGAVAEEQGAGHVALGSSEIWASHPEKCLAVRAAWGADNPMVLQALLRALLRAGRVCDDRAQAGAVADLLGSEFPGLSRTAWRAALPGGGAMEQLYFHAPAVWFPWRGHAKWFLGQMGRWGWLDGITEQEKDVAAQSYHPDLLEAVARSEGLNWPDEAHRPQQRHRGAWVWEADPRPIDMRADLFCDD
ncbi:MAG TPA: CmpA/NrtA family ABC transporter substrate-binding protein [Acetobacteraceae bacterium]|nr:CmpA/NrtA family ABC transporter substrate-binding protein [Acetobacteraceae bacterium]